MAETKNNVNILLDANRAFLPSKSINIFPCSRRGQYEMEASVKHYDPEARLNTERTNRLHTAINGFTDSFIINNNFVVGGTLAFTLAGYRIEVKDFSPVDIAAALNISTGGTIYAHLSLHNKVSLSAEDYHTEILYRQSTVKTNVNYLDVAYTVNGTTEWFFVGVSFTKDEVSDGNLPSYNLPLFSYSTDKESWELVQTSLLPKIEHGETEDSIKVNGAFAIEQAGETSFEINEGGVGTVNVPLHITKGTTIDGGVTLKAGVDAFSLIVGAPVGGGEIFPEGTIKAKGHIETPTLEATESIKTPELKTDTITSDSDVITVDKKLTLSTNTSITAPVANVHSTLNVTNSAKNAKADVDELVADKATIGDLIVKADSGLNSSTGKITTLNFQATNNATIYDLDVGTNIDTSTLKATNSIETPLLNVVDEGKISTPTVETAKITSNSAEIVVDKVLKVDTIDSDATNGLTVKRATKLEKTLVVDGATAVNDTITAEKLIISKIDDHGEEKGEVVTPTLRVNRLTTNSGNITVDDKNLIVTKNLEVLAAKAIDEEDRVTAATATIDKAVIGQLEVKADITKLTESTGKITAEEIAAEKITQNGNQVPAITLEQISDIGVTPEVWQLQIANVIKKHKD